MSEHTPKPWRYIFEGGTVAFIVEADGTAICKVSTIANSTAHSRLIANARLIAAAPDLLAALRDIANYNSQTHSGSAAQILDENARIARVAIEAATGER